ncbi:MAG: hypothetical protein ACYDAD_09010 [Acidimicrobiales bacterium]
MRPNWVGWFLVALFFVGGMAFMIPEQTRGIWIGQIWVAVSLGLATLYVLMMRRADRADELRRGRCPRQGGDQGRDPNRILGGP